HEWLQEQVAVTLHRRLDPMALRAAWAFERIPDLDVVHLAALLRFEHESLIPRQFIEDVIHPSPKPQLLAVALVTFGDERAHRLSLQVMKLLLLGFRSHE